MKAWPGNAALEKTRFGHLARGELMSRVRSSGNKSTEQRLAILLRKSHVTGWRRNFDLLGKPDFAWPKIKLAVFVDGCFWHGHACGRNLDPRTNAGAWKAKIQRNKRRDRRVARSLCESGWVVLRIWECALRTTPTRCVERIKRALDC